MESLHTPVAQRTRHLLEIVGERRERIEPVERRDAVALAEAHHDEPLGQRHEHVLPMVAERGEGVVAVQTRDAPPEHLVRDRAVGLVHPGRVVAGRLLAGRPGRRLHPAGWHDLLGLELPIAARLRCTIHDGRARLMLLV